MSFSNAEFILSNPGTGAQAGQKIGGGKSIFSLVATAMATSTTIKLEASLDNGTSWFDVRSEADTDVSVTASAAVAEMFNLNLPPCQVRTNVTAGGGATTTVTIRVTDSVVSRLR